MPNPLEIATVIANGVKYDTWTEVHVERTYDFQNSLAAHMRLRAVEVEVHGASGIFPVAQRLAVNDQAQGFLAGQLVITGNVVTRQVAYDSKEHGVEIIVSSLSNNVQVSTVDAEPGQYCNQTLHQIGSACFGKVGVGFSIQGSPAGADKPFPRVSEHVGETRFEFIERLCRMRNIHMIDNGLGNVHGTRSPSGGGATLEEGRNIWRARYIERIDDTANHLTFVGQKPGSDTDFSEPSSSASTSVPNVSLSRPQKLVCELNADNQDCAMRVNHERDITLFDMVDATITVKGWFDDSGTLWIMRIGQTVSVYSPMLFPDNQRTLYIKGVIHKQSVQEGTTTEIMLTNQPGDTIAPSGTVGPQITIGP